MAIFGIAFNGYAYLRISSGKSQNEKVLSWHMLEDMLGWVVVLVGSVVMFLFDIRIIDPIMIIGFTTFILYGVSKNLAESVKILMEGIPPGIDIELVIKELKSINGVRDVNDVHIWSLDGEENMITVHVVADNRKVENIKKNIRKRLERYGITHSTIEIESKPCEGCNLSGRDLPHG